MNGPSLVKTIDAVIATPATKTAVLDAGSDVHVAAEVAPTQLRRRTARGMLVSMTAQLSTFVLRTVSLFVMARLLLKQDFGVVNMATAFMGLVGLARDGLSMATVQRASITRAQASTLFWVNIVVGLALALMTAAAAPLLAAFYREPRLVWVMVALGSTLFLSSAAAQHRAMLQRNLRFSMLAAIDILSYVFSVTLGITMAANGFGYWSLAGMMIGQPAAAAVGVWLTAGWNPGLPERGSGIRSMLAFGGAVSLNSFVTYFAYNLDKVLIGRVWGAAALGIYGRAYQLISLPNENLNSTISLVVFPALARVQHDARQLATFFLKGYRVFLAVVVPIVAASALFAGDIVLVALGPKWGEAVAPFRQLAPAIMCLSMVNPFAPLILASGQAARCIKIALFVTPILATGYLLGVSHGPEGVAVGFSGAMLVAVVPVLFWARHGTRIEMIDLLKAARPAAVSIALAAGVAYAAQGAMTHINVPLLRLIAESAILFSVYIPALLFLNKEKSLYIQLLRDMSLWPGGRTAHA